MDTLAVTGLSRPLSRAVLGTMTFGDTADETAARRMFDAAVAAGVTAIDTANGYANGTTEGLLARLIAPVRDDLTIATKAGMPHPDAAGDPPLSRAALERSIDGSRRRLNIERIDLFYLHQPDRSTPIEETLDTLSDYVDSGAIGAIGVSNFAAWQISDLLAVAERSSTKGPVIAQQLYNLVARRIEDEYIEFARAHRIATVVYNPLAGGLLAGSHALEKRPDSGRFGSSAVAEMYTARYWKPSVFNAVAAVNRIAEEAGIAPAALAIRWLRSKPGVDAILLGASKPEHFIANLEAFAQGPLEASLVEQLDAATVDLHGAMPAYNR